MQYFTVEYNSEPYHEDWNSLSVYLFREEEYSWEELQENYRLKAQSKEKTGVRIHLYTTLDNNNRLFYVETYIWLNLQKRPRFINKDN